jgi:hypothetical protein
VGTPNAKNNGATTIFFLQIVLFEEKTHPMIRRPGLGKGVLMDMNRYFSDRSMERPMPRTMGLLQFSFCKPYFFEEKAHPVIRRSGWERGLLWT